MPWGSGPRGSEVVLASTRVSPVTLSFSTVISTEYMAGTRGARYTTTACPRAPGGSQARDGEPAARAKQRGSLAAAPTQRPSAALCSALDSLLAIPPHL